MYRRPNAPFKPPRPIGSGESAGAGLKYSAGKARETQISRKVPETSGSQELFVSDDITTTGQAKRPIPAESEHVKPQPSREQPESQSGSRFFSVQWRKRSNKKHKAWEGDGYIVVSEKAIVLKIEQKKSFRAVGRTSKLNTEGVISLGMYEAEIDTEMSRQEVLTMCGGPEDKDEPGLESSETPPKPLIRAPDRPRKKVKKTVENSKSPATEDIPGIQLPRGNIPNEKSVVIDPQLTKVLRPHQRDGVSFLYECIMGFKVPNYKGALLADEMGLGKTLMTIALIWTLLRQSPFADESAVIRKVLICCPVSLIDNWRKEFKKWLDMNRIGVLTLNSKQLSALNHKQDIVNFGKTKVFQVLIMSYEKVLSCSESLSTVNFDLLVCDEGHRLKNESNKVLKSLNEFNIARKLVLTGTPIQNDLNEFFNIVNFINPGILGSRLEFQKLFLKPILRARDVSCMNNELIKEGKEKSSELIDVTKAFTLRRTKSVINKYLTKKTDIILFCPPSKLQRELFDAVLKSNAFTSVMNSETRDVFSIILTLRKICNSPSLVASDPVFESVKSELFGSLTNRTSGSKINVLVPLLLDFQKMGEKTVLVSNYTQTLDFLELVLLKLNIQYSRLDGSTPAKIRDKLVVDFNKNPLHQVFLLSAKAGGVGLNLVGASRLVLYDNDWNPLVDLQAMARIHRDGQSKPVFIYRLFTTGAIDEKIFQRQLMKNNLSDMFIDDQTESVLNVFDYEDLKDLFTIADTNCNTHDLLDCECLGLGEDVDLSQKVELHDTQEDSELPSSGFMSASEFKDLDGKEAAKKQSIRSALTCYKHFDPSVFEEGMDTGDAILNGLLLKTKKHKAVSYVLTHADDTKL